MNNTKKTALVLFCLFCSLIGFLIKLPAAFRGQDKILHSGFYFLAAAFFHLLFRKSLLMILFLLFLFGILIEYLQELSNKITHTHIHGKFDSADVYANLRGLAAYAFLAVLVWIFKKISGQLSNTK